MENRHGPPRAAAHVDDTPCILIEDPEGNMMRSVQIHPLISAVTILTNRNQGVPFSRARGSITPVAVSPSPLPRDCASYAGSAREQSERERDRSKGSKEPLDCRA
eukprot:6021971-Prymnesium_polylepis.1